MPSEVLVVVSVEFSGSGNLSSGGGGRFVFKQIKSHCCSARNEAQLQQQNSLSC